MILGVLIFLRVLLWRMIVLRVRVLLMGVSRVVWCGRK